MSPAYLEVAVIFLLILLNGFLSMSEMAVVSSRRIRLKTLSESGDRKAGIALRLSESPDNFFSTVQIGITLIGVLTGAFGGATIAKKLEDYLLTFQLLAPYHEILGLSLVVIPITYFTLIFGELIPKRMAYNHPEKLAIFSAPVMRFFMGISHPAVKLLSYSTRIFIRVFGLRLENSPSVTEEELKGIIGESARVGVLETAEKEMLERTIRLGDRQVKAMMTHRSKVVWIDLEDSWEENIKKIEKNPYSRFPVAKGDLSKMIGVLKAKDYLIRAKGKSTPDIKSVLLQPLYVPETMRVLKLLELFKHQPRMHFAAIIDEHGDVQGILTLNDILEAIVGDIPSVGERTEPTAIQREDGSWIMDALLPIDEVLSILKIHEEDEEKGTYQTLAGFILRHMGEIPTVGNYVEVNGYRFEVMDMDGKRIDSVLVSPMATESIQ